MWSSGCCEPLEVLDAGPISLGGPKQRALRGQTLARERVGVGRPTRPRLRTPAAAARRRRLGAARDPPASYALQLGGSDEFDLYAFERLSAEARAAADPAVAARRLRKALALWRGPVGRLTGPGVTRPAQVACERRLDAGAAELSQF